MRVCVCVYRNFRKVNNLHLKVYHLSILASRPIARSTPTTQTYENFDVYTKYIQICSCKGKLYK